MKCKKKHRTKKILFENLWKRELARPDRRIKDDFYKKNIPKIWIGSGLLPMTEFYEPDDGTSWSITLIYQRLWNTLQSGKLSGYSDGLWDGRPGFESRQGKDFSLFLRVQAGSRAQPTSYHSSFLGGLKRPKREADHSPPPSAEVNNGGTIPPLPHKSSSGHT
jgi:hypothetical protein